MTDPKISASSADPAEATPLGLVRSIFDAYERGDAEAVLDACDPDITWISSTRDTLPWSQGLYRGRQAVAQYFMDFGRFVTGVRLEVTELLPYDNRVVVLGYMHAKPHHRPDPYRARFAQIWTVCAGKAIAMEGIVDTMAIAQGLDPDAAHLVDRIRNSASATPDSGA